MRQTADRAPAPEHEPGGEPPPRRRVFGPGGVERRTFRSRAARLWEGIADFIRRVYVKAGEDNLFFMAGAIAFNILVAFVPLVLAILGIAGRLLQTIESDPAGVLADYVLRALPGVVLTPELEQRIRDFFLGLLDASSGFIGVGTVIFIWVATRLVGSLRTALREVFDIQQERGIIAGKIFDIQMVLLAGTLFSLNVGLTVLIAIVAETGEAVLDLHLTPLASAAWGQLVAFVSLWVMFLLIYRYLPSRRTRWSTSIIAATFTSTLLELMKMAFSWYVVNVAEYGSTYGSLAVLAIFVIWVYYGAVVFIVGGEVAQVAAMRRVRMRQRERLV